MFFGSMCLFDEDNSLNYEEFELTEFMDDEQLEYWRSKDTANAPANAELNQVGPDAKN